MIPLEKYTARNRLRPRTVSTERPKKKMASELKIRCIQPACMN